MNEFQKKFVMFGQKKFGSQSNEPMNPILRKQSTDISSQIRKIPSQGSDLKNMFGGNEQKLNSLNDMDLVDEIDLVDCYKPVAKIPENQNEDLSGAVPQLGLLAAGSSAIN